MPIVEEINGDTDFHEEGTLARLRDATRVAEQLVKEKEVINLTESTNRMQALLKRGFGKRAVVCHNRLDKFDPQNWGIVVDIKPFSLHPLEIKMVGVPGIIRTNGNDLAVIYPTMSMNELHAYFQGRIKGFQ